VGACALPQQLPERRPPAWLSRLCRTPIAGRASEQGMRSLTPKMRLRRRVPAMAPPPAARDSLAPLHLAAVGQG
jgi:hypothetical protein